MTKRIQGYNLGFSSGIETQWSMPQGTIILDCQYTKNSGVALYVLIKDESAPMVTRKFVFYGNYVEPKLLDNRNRYWHVGTAFQKIEPSPNMNGTTNYIPDDIPVFIFEVE